MGFLKTAREDTLENDRFVCSVCRKEKSKELYHCIDHTMDMCAKHVKESSAGRFFCKECDKLVHKFLHDGKEWVKA